MVCTYANGRNEEYILVDLYVRTATITMLRWDAKCEGKMYGGKCTRKDVIITIWFDKECNEMIRCNCQYSEKYAGKCTNEERNKMSQ